MAISENPQKPDGFDDKIENLKFMKENMPHKYAQTIYEIKDMADGDDLDGVRQQYYSGWENADFENLLMELGETE